MQKLLVKSRMIESIYFSQTDGQLYIRFHNGESRGFADVPKEEVVAMCAAKSPGQHYIDRIRTHFRRVAA